MAKEMYIYLKFLIILFLTFLVDMMKYKRRYNLREERWVCLQLEVAAGKRAAAHIVSTYTQETGTGQEVPGAKRP